MHEVHYQTLITLMIRLDVNITPITHKNPKVGMSVSWLVTVGYSSVR